MDITNLRTHLRIDLRTQSVEMVAVVESTAKKYINVGYNKAAIAFIKARGDNTKNSRPQAVKASKPNFSRQLTATTTLLLCPIWSTHQWAATLMASRKRWNISNLVGKLSVYEGDRSLVLPHF